MDGDHLEQGGSWRPLWLVATVLAVLVVLDVALPGSDVPPLLWVLGGGWSLPRGRTDGTTVLVPTRAPDQLAAALLRAHPACTAEPGRVDP